MVIDAGVLNAAADLAQLAQMQAIDGGDEADEDKEQRGEDDDDAADAGHHQHIDDGVAVEGPVGGQLRPETHGEQLLRRDMDLRRWSGDEAVLEEMDDAQRGVFGRDAEKGHGEVVAEVGELLFQHMRGMVVVAEAKKHAAPFKDDADDDRTREVTGNDEHHAEGQEDEAEQTAFAWRLLCVCVRRVVFRLACHTPSVACCGLRHQSSNPSSSAVSSASIWS